MGQDEEIQDLMARFILGRLEGMKYFGWK